jgi:AraC family ethanolamine operon transcriptional activator
MAPPRPKWQRQRRPSAQKVQEFPPLVRQVRFACVEELEALLRGEGLEVQLFQLQGGAQTGDLLSLRLGPLRLLRLRLARALHTSGAKPTGRQMVTLALDPPGRAVPVRAHGHLLPACSLFGLDCRGEIHLSTGPACHLALVSIDRELFRSRAAAIAAGPLGEDPLPENWLRLDPQRFEGLRRYLSQLFALAETTPAALGLTSWERLVPEDLIPLVVEALTQASGQRGEPQRPPARIELVKLAQRWMRENPRQPISLDALCRQVHVGRRSLIQGFRDHMGMGPMAFLKLQRLHGVRRQLLAAHPGDATIQRLAADWGFLNPGHFARDYRLLFGEVPSETLARSGLLPPQGVATAGAAR